MANLFLTKPPSKLPLLLRKEGPGPTPIRVASPGGDRGVCLLRNETAPSAASWEENPAASELVEVIERSRAGSCRVHERTCEFSPGGDGPSEVLPNRQRPSAGELF